MMLKRIITGLLLMGVGIFTVMSGGLPLYLWMVLVTLMVVWELFTMTGIRKNKWGVFLGLVTVILVLVLAMKLPHIWGNLFFKIGFGLVVLVSGVELYLNKIF
ncbi:MAG: phosphatidate cytidylyltransferase, partial [Candidatus Margulisbacteria bacterium]|nr:phosphatidate cytidylyltransferase [Candidatus Margulisiibacteriota bacterium]